MLVILFYFNSILRHWRGPCTVNIWWILRY